MNPADIEIKFWPLPKHINGAGGFPNFGVVNSRLTFTMDELRRIKNNERIHVIQQIEFSPSSRWTWRGYFKWAYVYLKYHFRHGYGGNPFEIDSRRWDEDIQSRPAVYWKLIGG